jgi:hypothetical protein
MHSRTKAAIVAVAAGIATAFSTATAPTATAAPTARDQSATPAEKAASEWTRISQGRVPSINVPGLYRTGDGVLHVAYGNDGGSTPTNLAWANVSERGRLLGRGTILSGWNGFANDPKLIAGPDGRIRVVFAGRDLDGAAPYDEGRVYTATAGVAGDDWSIAPGAMTLEDTLTYGISAVAIPNQDPIAAFAKGSDLYWRQAGGETTPTTPDSHLAFGSCCASYSALARDTRNGRVVLAWYRSGNTKGVFVRQLRPTAGPTLKAPGSSTDPHQTVALTGRRGASGVYAAYCSGGPLCKRGIRLWRVGARKAIRVPLSARADTVAIAAAPRGRLWVVWEKDETDKVYAALTNPKGNRFGAVRAVRSGAAGVFRLSAAGGATRRVDVVINNGRALFHRQFLPGLTMRAKPRMFSNDKRRVVTFAVTDAGTPVAGAKVRVAGKTKVTGARGKVKIPFRKGIKPGRYRARAIKAGYVAAQALVRVRR